MMLHPFLCRGFACWGSTGCTGSYDFWRGLNLPSAIQNMPGWAAVLGILRMALHLTRQHCFISSTLPAAGYPPEEYPTAGHPTAGYPPAGYPTAGHPTAPLGSSGTGSCL